MSQSEIVASTFRWSNEATGIVGSDILSNPETIGQIRSEMRPWYDEDECIGQVLRVLESNREEHEWTDEDGFVRIVIFNFLCKTWETPSYRDVNLREIARAVAEVLMAHEPMMKPNE
tara:strand:- start:8916 stop:9266 length:351 start_codon:yes stop_codon:yes gene_type:complete